MNHVLSPFLLVGSCFNFVYHCTVGLYSTHGADASFSLWSGYSTMTKGATAEKISIEHVNAVLLQLDAFSHPMTFYISIAH